MGANETEGKLISDMSYQLFGARDARVAQSRRSDSPTCARRRVVGACTEISRTCRHGSKAVGGSTVHWAGASLRFHAHEFRRRVPMAAWRVAGGQRMQ